MLENELRPIKNFMLGINADRDTIESLKEKLTSGFNDIHQKMRIAAINTTKLIENRQARKFVRKNKWWDDILELLHKKKCEAYRTYKQLEFNSESAKKEYRYWKKKFRVQQKKNIEMLKNHEARILKKLYKNNRNKFWQALKSKQKSNNEIAVDITTLENEYKSLFNDKLISNTNAE